MSITYIDVPVVTDPDDLAADAITFLQLQFPGWTPNAGDLLTWTIEAIARIGAEIGNVASTVPTTIFRYLGPLFGVPPINATPATVTSTWTMRDNAGYTIAAGTLVGIPGPGGTTVPFGVLNDLIVDAGDTATADGAVTLVAVTAGAAASGLGSTDLVVPLINILDYITAVTLTGATTGGVDAEADSDYLNRLAAELKLLTPRPILPADYAALYRSIAGVTRVLAIDLYQPAVNEVQTVTVVATGGTFTLSFGGHTTAAIAWDAAATDVEAALELLASIGANGVNCTGGPLPSSPVTVTFVNANGGINQAAITATATSLTGTSHAVTITTVTNGAAAITDQERTVAVAALDENGNDVDSGIKAAGTTMLQALREINFIVNALTPIYTAIDVTFTYVVVAGYDPAAVQIAAEAAVTSFLNPAVWGMPASGDTAAWVDTPTVRQLDIAAAVSNVQGVQHVATVELCVHGGSLATSDVTLPGPASLPTAGTISGSAA